MFGRNFNKLLNELTNSDPFFGNLNNFEKKTYRVLTYLFYLNDVDEGGETEFYGGDIKIKPKQGKMILFPSSWTYPHSGKMPVSSNKYIITGWIYNK